MAIQIEEPVVVDALQPPIAQLAYRSVAEFFAGIGLMRMGLERQGWRVIFSNDIDEKKEAMYRDCFKDSSHFLLGDIHRMSSEVVPMVSLATASFPCTDLSLAGGRNGLSGEQSSAFWGFVRILEEMGQCKPPLILLENVPDFLTSRGGQDFCSAMQSLNDLGYSVDAFILDAACFVPQSRERLFVVGTLDTLYDGNTDDFPSGQSSLSLLRSNSPRPKHLTAYIMKHQHDIRWRVRQLPPVRIVREPLEAILEDLPHEHPFWWSRERAQYFLQQMSPSHRKIAESMIADDTWSYGTAFRRMRKDKVTGVKRSMAELRTDGVAGCLRTPKGGSAKQILFKAGKGEYHVRLLTPREYARLMGADAYPLPKSLDQAYFGFGDAVCVPVVEWVATQYLNPLVDEIISSHLRSPGSDSHNL